MTWNQQALHSNAPILQKTAKRNIVRNLAIGSLIFLVQISALHQKNLTKVKKTLVHSLYISKVVKFYLYLKTSELYVKIIRTTKLGNDQNIRSLWEQS